LSAKTKHLLLVTVLMVIMSLLISACSCYTVSEKLDSILQQLVEAERRGEAESYAEQHEIELVDGNVRVIVECDPDMIEEATEAARALGVVEREAIVTKDLVDPRLKVLIPITSLNTLAREKSVTRVELPSPVIPEGQ
jgi:hypothetical protein